MRICSALLLLLLLLLLWRGLGTHLRAQLPACSVSMVDVDAMFGVFRPPEQWAGWRPEQRGRYV
eukprot:3812476-Pyramimonas_sp.AAC.1